MYFNFLPIILEDCEIEIAKDKDDSPVLLDEFHGFLPLSTTPDVLKLKVIIPVGDSFITSCAATQEILEKTPIEKITNELKCLGNNKYKKKSGDEVTGFKEFFCKGVRFI